MKAIAFEQFGGPEQLKLLDLPKPPLGDNDVMIEIAYTSVNQVDWKIREGYLKDYFPHEFPLIPGWDAAGTVSALGKNARDFKIGERVYAYCRKPTVRWGTYAEYTTMDAAAVAPMPSNASFAEAATIPLVGLTAYQALFDTAQLRRGQTILVNAGAGGVGGIAIQFARHAGATVISTASAGNHDYVKSLGAHDVVDYQAGDFAAAVRKLMPGGVDVVLETVGGETQKRSYETLKPGGILVSITDTPDDGMAACFKVRNGYLFVSPNGAQLREIAALFERGVIKPPRLEEMPLEQARAAQERSRQHHVAGKIVLRIK
jgi:NADPH2:quinone reductase